jgi:hypothetical protein
MTAVLLVAAFPIGYGASQSDHSPDQSVTPPPRGVGTNAGRFPICPAVVRSYAERIRDGLAVMRRTSEGERLFHLLLERDACVEVEHLREPVLARALPRGPLGDLWSESAIQVDADVVRDLAPDLLAPLLVHEAAHIERFVTGADCFSTRTCTFLASGAKLEEEVAAHAAEARWWIEVYGEDGKGEPGRHGASLDRLARVYLTGDGPFERFVRSFRDDAL